MEEINNSLSSIAIGSSSKSLADVSWLDSAPQSEASLVLPEWIESSKHKHTHASKEIKLVVNGQTHTFPVEKHPTTEEGAEKVCRRAEGHKGVFFLWGRQKSEKEIHEKNNAALKAFAGTGSLGDVCSASAITDRLTKASLQHSVSFVHIAEESLECVLESLRRSLSKTESSILKVKVKKQADPERILEGLLKEVTGIKKTEVSLLVSRYKTVANLVEGFSEAAEGIRETVVERIRALLQ
ncbi:hypothetical protein NECID01_0706 [Nematocida sp. AWRm77]|nr:hypothetical protein NECID01_0706 [Nematocida sp. AWRm77]